LAFGRVFVPALRAFEPELMLVSAGQAAHRADPLAQMELESRSYALLAQRLRALGRPIIAVLEGGYDLDGVGQSAAGTLEALLGVAAPAPAGEPAACHPQAVRSCAATIEAPAGPARR